MKVYLLQSGFGIDNLALADRADPKPGPGQVLLKMRAWSLNYRDLMVVKGQYNPNMMLPMIPLSDGVGEVAAVGDGVTRVKVGERVAGIFMQKWLAGDVTTPRQVPRSAAAMTACWPNMWCWTRTASWLFRHLSDEEAATLPWAAVTAWNVLSLKAGSTGDTVLVQGTGGVSLFALQFARLAGRGYHHVEQRRQAGRACGSSAPPTASTTKPRPNGANEARELTGGGASITSSRSAAPARWRNRCGPCARAAHQPDRRAVRRRRFNPMPILMKNVRVQGIFVGSRAMFEAMNRAIALHQLRPVVDKVFGFNEMKGMLRHMESGAHFGKICITAG